MLKDEAAAEDLVQTIFIEFWQKQLYLQIEESLEGYLFRAVHNRSLNEIKRLQRLTHRAEGYLQELDEAVDPKEPEIGEDKESIMSLLDERYHPRILRIPFRQH
ncbi:RNA polymerase sigma-70 factor, ECF subfamily [bacterium A37T11]|nr:RNA polymerase sigma-70 factor, ECF subfamily [bacterium A37T11]